MRERDIENYLRDQVRQVGGIAYKWTSPGNNGVPDRIVMLPDAPDLFIELKAPGGRPTKLQLNQQRRIQNLGRLVLVIDSREQIDSLIAAYEEGILEYYVTELMA